MWKLKCEEKQYEEIEKLKLSLYLESSAKLMSCNNLNPGGNIDRSCDYFTTLLSQNPSTTVVVAEEFHKS